MFCSCVCSEIMGGGGRKRPRCKGWWWGCLPPSARRSLGEIGLQWLTPRPSSPDRSPRPHDDVSTCSSEAYTPPLEKAGGKKLAGPLMILQQVPLARILVCEQVLSTNRPDLCLSPGTCRAGGDLAQLSFRQDRTKRWGAGGVRGE